MTTATCNFPYYSFQEQPCYYRAKTDFLPLYSDLKNTVLDVVRTVSSLLPPLVPEPETSSGEFIVEPADEYISHSPVDRLQATIKELIDYLFLPHNWDTFNGQPARPRAMLDVLDFLKHFPNTLPTPKPMLSGSGIVGLYWDFGSHYASLEFEGDGTYTYLTDSPEGYDGDEGIAAVALPTKLRLYLAQLPVAG